MPHLKLLNELSELRLEALSPLQLREKTLELLALLTPASPVVPGRPLRALIARLLVEAIRLDPKHLFDTTHSLLNQLNQESKPPHEIPTPYRVAACTVLAHVWTAHGDQVMSLFVPLLLATTKLYKASSLPIILRTSALATLTQAIVVGGKSMSDQTIKDTVKALKYGLADKSGPIARGSAQALSAIASTTQFFVTLAEIENILTPTLRALESADHPTRRSLSQLSSILLSHTQSPGSALLAVPKKKKVEESNPTAGASGAGAGVAGAAADEDDIYPTIGAPTGVDLVKKTLLSPQEMMSILSSLYNKSSTSRKLRNGLVDVYATLFTALGSDWVEQSYGEIVKHLLEEIANGPSAGTSYTGWNAKLAERTDPARARFDAISTRKAVEILLRDILSGRLLSESSQISAITEMCEIVLKKWGNLLPTREAGGAGGALVSKQSLIVVLNEISGLLSSLGWAPVSTQDILYDPLLRLVSHPSHSVQLAATWCIRTLCNTSPHRLSSSIVTLIDLLQKDLSTLLSSTTQTLLETKANKKAIGHAQALAGLINLIPHQPLYVSFDLSAKCMSLAIQLFKSSGNHQLHISGIEIQVAWILVSSLMSLGPNFVRLHLPQLLILWRNALPKPTAKDGVAATVRGENEWGFLLHIRECTLGAILSFLRHNGGSSQGRSGSGASGLVDEDVGRRLVALLSNAMTFLSSFAAIHGASTADQLPSTSSTLQLVDREALFRRRLLQCFEALGQNVATRSFQVSLLTSVVTIFSDADKYSGESSVQNAIAINSGSFSTIWEEVDGYAFGITSRMQNAGEVSLGGDGVAEGEGRKFGRLNRDLTEDRIQALAVLPILGALENDYLEISTRRSSDDQNHVPSPPPILTGIIDSSLEIFSLYFPLQETPNQSTLLSQILSHLNSPRLEKNPGRKTAVLMNALAAILGSLRRIEKPLNHLSSRKGVDSKVGALMRDVLKEGLKSDEAQLRAVAAEGMGKLSNLGGTIFMANQIQFCVNQVVSNTDPSNRAGCALAFGEIYSQVGGLAAGPVLKTIVDVLLSLSSDPHPLVHFYALDALAKVIRAAGLAYEPFTNSTLGIISKLYLSDTHEPEGGTTGSGNLRGDLSVLQKFCRALNEIIGVLGPELKESERVRKLILVLLEEFSQEPDEGVIVEAIRATQHFLIFAPDEIDEVRLVGQLSNHLASSRQPIKLAAVNSVYQLVQRDAVMMSKLGGNGLVEKLFRLLDEENGIEGVRDAITSWLRQTADANPSGWIDLCQRIMSRTINSVSTKAAASALPSFADEESQGLGLDLDSELPRPGGLASGPRQGAQSRWRTQLFALQCLHEIFLTVIKSGRVEHFDITKLRNGGVGLKGGKRGLLLYRVADLIKMAFTASTAGVREIRLEGLVVLRDVIENFRQSQDTDFTESLLLEQFQAPIAAALTPAFAADSYPEVLASAIQVCAVFVGSGVVKDIEKMGRILKLLTGALESCRESEMTSLGAVTDLSTTASVMLKTSIFSAWAEFQIASIRQPYLVKVIQPHLSLLCPFWVASLREYARVRSDPEATSEDSGVGGATFDSVYSGLSRETALPFYEQSWPQMLHAVATLLRSNDVHMLRAVDGIDSPPSDEAPLVSTAQTKGEPALFFWVLFGISFEALCTAPPASGSTSVSSVQAIALEALVGLSRTEVSGNALSKAALFEELCNLCYRLTITEGSEIKVRVMQIVVQLALNFSADSEIESNGHGTRKDSKMTQCLRVATCVLQESIPSVNSRSSRATLATLPAHVNLLKVAFSSFADLADLHPMPMREELYAISFHFYAQLLKDETTEIDLAGPTLPNLKMLCTRGFSIRDGPLTTLPRVVNGMLSACLQNIDELRGRSGPIVATKTKNNLLASVLLLSALPPTVKIGQAVVEHACFLITQHALARDQETSTIALHCLTSLMVAAARGVGVVQSCVGQLLPGLIEFIARAGDENYPAGDPRLNSLAEVLRSFVGVLGGVAESHRSRALSIVLPTLILLPTSPEASPTPPPSHTLALGHLLTLAAANPIAFKLATTTLQERDKKMLESSIRASMGTASASREEERKEAKIELRSFG